MPPGSPWDGGWAAGSWPAEDFGWEEAPPGSRGTVAGLLEAGRLRHFGWEEVPAAPPSSPWHGG